MGNESKKTLGRRKIEMKKIEKRSNLQVTFTKRRTGLFKKASELALLCGAQIAILVQSPAGKMYSFGQPSVDALIHPFLTAEAPPPEMNSLSHEQRQIIAGIEYEEAAMRLEMEMRKHRGESWWNEPYEGLELHELEEYLEALQVLTDNVSKRADAKEMEEFMKLQDNFGSAPLYQQITPPSTPWDIAPVDNYDLFDLVFK